MMELQCFLYKKIVHSNVSPDVISNSHIFCINVFFSDRKIRNINKKIRNVHFI